MYLRSILIGILSLLFYAHPATADPKKSVKGIAELGSGKIEIKSETLEIDNQREMVTFSGGVDVQKDNINITCRQLLLYYHNKATDKDDKGDAGLGDADMSIQKIVVSGDVKITSDDGISATADKAVYYQDQEKVILSGNPIVKQGNDFVEGSKITLFLKEKRSTVIGSEDNRVRAVIFPRKKKR